MKLWFGKLLLQYDQRAKWKDNENQINSTNFSASFQTPSVFFPSMKYRFNFCMSPDWMDDLCFGFALFSFVNSLAFASNILLADMNSLSCKMFMFRLSGAQVRWRWMAALIPVNALGVNAWPFSVFTSAKNFRRISLKSVALTVLRSTVIFLYSHHFSNFFTPHSVALLVFFAWAFCSISSSCSLSKSEFWLEKSWKFGTSSLK